MEIGSIAELIGAITGSIALIAAYFAFKDTRKMLENDNKRLQMEKEIEMKSQASMVFVSVIRKEEPPKNFVNGVLLVNNSHSFIRNVCIDVELYDEKDVKPISIKYLIPGKYEIWRKDYKKNIIWDFPKQIDDNKQNINDSYLLTNTDKYKVKYISFIDAVGNQWNIDEEGLHENG